MTCFVSFFTVIVLFHSRNSKFVDACLATTPSQNPVVSSTTEPITDPPELRTCSSNLVSYGSGDTNDPQIAIDVNHSEVFSTQIGTTLETTNTMTVSCSAITNYIANMFFNTSNGQGPPENADRLQSIDVTLTCNSADQQWFYVITFQGQEYRIAINSVSCNQSP